MIFCWKVWEGSLKEEGPRGRCNVSQTSSEKSVKIIILFTTYLFGAHRRPRGTDASLIAAPTRPPFTLDIGTEGSVKTALHPPACPPAVVNKKVNQFVVPPPVCGMGSPGLESKQKSIKIQTAVAKAVQKLLLSHINTQRKKWAYLCVYNLQGKQF